MSVSCESVDGEEERVVVVVLVVSASANSCNNNNRSNVYGAISITKVIARVHPVHLMNVD